jgi:putative salt-induced outer membrane protein YdiY
MTCSSIRRGISPAAFNLFPFAVAFTAFVLPLTGRAQPPPVTNTTVTTVIITSISATNTTVTTNVTTKVEIVPPPVAWSCAATFGLTVTGGNSQTLTTTLDFNAARKTPNNELLLDVNGTYGETSDVKNAEQLDVTGQYNHLATHRLYYGIKLDGFHDGIAGIDYRLTASPLAGYYLIKNPATELGAEFGPGYVYERLIGSATTISQATLRAGERYSHKINGTTKIWQDFEILPYIQDFGNYYMDGEIGINTSITKHAGLTCYVQDYYYSMPALGRLHNDFKLVMGATYKF